MSTKEDWEKHARKLDDTDPIRAARKDFVLPEGLIYLDGNSLGALPRTTAGRMAEAITEEWGKGLIGSWNDAGWYELPLELGDRLGALVGAAPGQIVLCDTTSTNLYKALSAALEMRPDRSAIVMEATDFPTNLYIAEGVVSTCDRALERRLVPIGEDLLDSIDERVAAVALSHVNYRSGARHDLKTVTRAAQEAGAVVIWDLCHSAGVDLIELDRDGVDFAVGCSYKFLNGGPGAPAWIYVAQRHLGRNAARQPLTGWMGHRAPFEFTPDYVADPGIRGFLCGTPHVLALRAVESGLDIFSEWKLGDLRRKAEALTQLFIDRVEAHTDTNGIGLSLVSPRNPSERGAQVSFAFEHGYDVVQALITEGVVGDFRAPDVMRFGFSPLYLTYAEVERAARRLGSVVSSTTRRTTDSAPRPVVT